MFFYTLIFFLIGLKFIMTKKSKLKPTDESSGWEPGWCNWSKSSSVLLSNVEKRILSNIKIPYDSKYVDIGSIVGENDRIWTLSFNTSSKNTPLVLLHGLGAGVALWVKNLKDLAADRPVYAIDVLGFGRSSRPTFSSKGKIVEMQMVSFIEEWRRVMKLDNFILLGHSLGGYLSALYTMQYPEKIKHLILADPWGMQESPPDVMKHYKVPFWARMLVYMFKPLNPLWALRLAGPWGQNLIGKARANLVAKFIPFLPQAEELIPQYIHQCNCQKPSGESAFHSMMHMWAFARTPIVGRINRWHPETRITIMFGEKSWVDDSVGEVIKAERKDSFVDIHVIPDAGHHIYLDQPELFSKIVFNVGQREDNPVN